MKTTLPILLAALLPLAACSVPTGELKPKTAADCGPDAKACGYKCVSVLDPTTGCGDRSSCTPCPAAAAYCDATTFRCQDPSVTCSGMQTQCDGIGACEDLGTDERNCGACGHACEGGFGCVGGLCDGPSMAAGNSARGILVKDGVLYWVDDGDGGRLMSWDVASPIFGSMYANALVGQLDSRPGAPNVFRLAVHPTGQQIYTVGWSGSPTDDFTVWATNVGTTGAGVVFSAPWLSTTPPPSIDGLAATTDDAIFVGRSDALQPWIWNWTNLTFLTSPSVGTESIRGITSVGRRVYYGRHGSIVSTDVTGLETPVLTNTFGSAPHRIAVVPGAPQELFWISEDDGSVYRWTEGGVPDQIHPGGGATKADIAADAHGAYWADRAQGTVFEWRRDGWVFPLAKGVTPNGVAVDGTYVYFTDGALGWVYRVPK